MFHLITPDSTKPFIIGRKESSDLRFGDLFVSREHAIIEKKDENWILKNLTANSVTLLNDEPVEESILTDGDVILIGVRKLRINLKENVLSLLIMDSNDESESIHLENEFREINIEDENTTNHSIQTRLFKNKAEIICCKNTIDENGKKLKRIYLSEGQNIQYAKSEISLTGDNLLIRKAQTGFDVSVKNLDVFAGKKQLLSDINFDLPAGKILAIIGRSGQGKSSLLRLLEGLYKKTETSKVFIGGLDYRNNEIRKRIAFLPQEPALRKDLTIEETLLHGGIISMDKDSYKSNAIEQVNKFCELFGLSHRKKNRIQTLSGGEARRVALAQELMGSPGLIILDEPLSGLDPYNSKILCSHLKQLAFLGHTIILTTHSYDALKIANKVLVLHQGKQCFFGSLEESFTFFKSKDANYILANINDETAIRWSEESSTRLENIKHPKNGFYFTKKKYSSLWLYNIKLMLKQWTRDKGKLIALLLQPLIIGFLFSQIFSSNSSLWTVAFAIILCANWFSLSLSIREIVQEKDILQNELRKGLSIPSFFFVKASIPSFMAFIQTFIVFIFVAVKMNIYPSFLNLFAIMLLMVLPAVGIGLVVSSLAKNPGQANAFLPLLIIPQVALAGALVPLDQMQVIAKSLSYIIWSRYNQNSFLNLLLDRPDETLNVVAAALLTFIFYIITIMILKRTSKAR